MSFPVPQGAPARPLTPAEDRQWAFLAHCGGILGCIPAFIIHKTLGPRGPFTAQESLEALNFTLPPTIVALLLNVVALVAFLADPSLGSLFALLALGVWVFLTVFSVIAAIRVNRGQPHRYLLNLRLLK